MTTLPSTTCTLTGQSLSDLFYNQEQLKYQVLNQTNPASAGDAIRQAREYPGSPAHLTLEADATEFLAALGNPAGVTGEDLVENFLSRV
jgi:hypothetical protein